MSGYSGTPLPKKLGVKADSRVRVVNAPESLFDLLESLPEGVEVAHGAGSADVALVFATRLADLERAFASAEPHVSAGDRLWAAWPKKAAKVPTDLTEDVVREVGLALGLVDVKDCAIDATWSGLCFMRRRK